VKRIALYVLCAAAAAGLVWLLLARLAPGPEPAGERQGAGRTPESAQPPRFGERPATDPAHLEPIEPDDEHAARQAEFDAALRSVLDGATGAAPDAVAGAGATPPGSSGATQPATGAGAPPTTGSGSGSAGGGGAGAGGTGGVTVPTPGDPRVLRPLDLPPETAPPEPEPEPEEDTGLLADPEIKGRILDNFPEDE
jgi:hypothetical protein